MRSPHVIRDGVYRRLVSIDVTDCFVRLSYCGPINTLLHLRNLWATFIIIVFIIITLILTSPFILEVLIFRRTLVLKVVLPPMGGEGGVEVHPPLG